MRKTVEGIILAAGLSTRMGRQKLTLEVHGAPVISRVVRAALESDLNRIILVTGPSNTQLAKALGADAGHERLFIAVNDRPERGMSSSLRTGIMMLSKESPGVMLILGDQPFLTVTVINKLLAEFDKESDQIIAPLIQGRRTNPVIFPASLFPELAKVEGDVGGRPVLRNNPDRVVGIEMGGYYDDVDLDNADDLQRIRESSRNSEFV